MVVSPTGGGHFMKPAINVGAGVVTFINITPSHSLSPQSRAQTQNDHDAFQQKEDLLAAGVQDMRAACHVSVQT